MNSLGSLTELDMSQNSLGGGNQIQYNLPNMKLERLNLAGNQFGGNLPYSISTMSNLKYLSVPLHPGVGFTLEYVSSGRAK